MQSVRVAVVAVAVTMFACGAPSGMDGGTGGGEGGGSVMGGGTATGGGGGSTGGGVGGGAGGGTPMGGGTATGGGGGDVGGGTGGGTATGGGGGSTGGGGGDVGGGTGGGTPMGGGTATGGGGGDMGGGTGGGTATGGGSATGGGGGSTGPVCGNGTPEGTEACDDGNMTNGDGCDNNCTVSACGNGVPAGTEACDDGNTVNGDGCDNNCTASACGNGISAAPEGCDDGNTTNNDGCSNTCVVELGFNCTGTAPTTCGTVCSDGLVRGAEQCDDGNMMATDGCSATCTTEQGYTCTGNPSSCAPTCGDGLKLGTEACDDGNPNSNDGCSDTCVVESGFTCTGSAPTTCATVCSDGIVRGAEQCDDGNLNGTDGCSATCTTEQGYTCTGSPSACAPTCGDGLKLATEACDDGNPNSNDGCSNTCTLELGFTCTGSAPTICTTVCSDGLVRGAEQCDDGNIIATDGCSPTCTTEPGYTCAGTPSVCNTTCGDGVRAGAEACDDAPPAENGDGCSATCAVETGYTCAGSPSVCSSTCGDGVIASNEACDDAPPAENGDGCSATCTVETGFACSGAPSVCASTCGDGMVASDEACDDAPPAENGDGCSANCAVELGFSCTGSPSTCAAICGDGIKSGTEACDDAPPAENGDGCSATCTIEAGWLCSGSMPSTCTRCGNGAVDPGEDCDDGNAITGDGCHQCRFDLGCASGEQQVVASNAVSLAVPDNTATGVRSPVTVTATGAVKKAGVFLNRITHTFDGDLRLGLENGSAFRRDLSLGNGSSGDNYVATFLEDGATVAVTAGSAPFTGRFRPQQTLSSSASADFLNKAAAGTWNLHLADTANGDTGTLQGWSLLLCVDPNAGFCGDGTVNGSEECDSATDPLCEPVTCRLRCGNGIVENLEECDDANRTTGDGCSSTCQLEFSCPSGQTAVVLRNTTSVAIPDNNLTGVLSSVNNTVSGAITRVGVGLSLSHLSDSDLDVYLDGPFALERELSTDNGSTGDHYRGTVFFDSATTLVTSGSAPFSGTFRPEQSLSTTLVTDFTSTQALGTWSLRVADDATGTTGTIDRWTLMLCVDPAAPACGDGVRNGAEECDDGNTSNTDVCSTSCQLLDGCGDGNLDSGELCDDNNVTSGDGCSATCQFDITCPAGQQAVVLSNSTPSSILDNNATGVTSTITQNVAGMVTKVQVGINVSHTADDNLDMFLVGPTLQRELSTDNGGTGDNYLGTTFFDAAATAITSGTAPFTGSFRPELTLSTTAGTDFRGTRAGGTWGLKVADDTANETGTLNQWTLMLCVDTTASYCGDGIIGAGEECEDGNTVDTDACSNTCQIVDGCGDGNIDAGEQCDDNNVTSGDGCSATCQPDIVCGAGEIPVLLSNNTSAPVPDTANGVFSTINVPVTGLVRKVIARVNVTHANLAHVDMRLVSPRGASRDLATDRSGANYVATMFSDAASTSVTSGTAPFTGTFKAQDTLSDLAGFLNQQAAGNWLLHVSDDTAGTAGNLNSWGIALCVDPSAATVCGNGIVESGETCDDANIVANDGCSSTCQLELVCAVGTPVVITSTDGPLLITDNNTTGITSNISVPTIGTVRKVVVAIGNIAHPFATDIDISVVSPMGTTVDTCSDNGSGRNYLSTIFDDAASVSITTGTAPFRGRFRPEVAFTAFNGQGAAGNWGLKLVDDTNQDTGILGFWSLGLCVEP